MPSPFPGMDPYLEAPDIWPDLLDALAGEIRGTLNQALPAPYYARLETRPEVGIVEEGGYARRIVPDVAVLAAPRTEPSPSIEAPVPSETMRHPFVEIRDPSRGHRLVTLIEIVSPSNKGPGPDREAYRRQQHEVLSSDPSLIELDLLREGERLLPSVSLAGTVAQLDPAPDYLILLNRAWQRGGTAAGYHFYPVRLDEPLPCIPVPLREGAAEVLLDLQFVFGRAYDSGPYRRGAVDYTRPPRPPLRGPAAAWAEERLRAAGAQVPDSTPGPT